MYQACLVRRLIQPRAGMAMRGPEADQQSELGGSCTTTALSGPDLLDPLSLLFSDLLTLVADRGNDEQVAPTLSLPPELDSPRAV